MADEKQFTIPLRKSFVKVPEYIRTKKAVRAIQKFILRHMKAEEVKIGQHLNLYMWQHGRKNPPVRIKVKSMKEMIDGVAVAQVELPEFEFAKKEEKKKESKSKVKEEPHTQKEELKEMEQDLEKKGKADPKEHGKDHATHPAEESKQEINKQKEHQIYTETGKHPPHKEKRK